LPDPVELTRQELPMPPPSYRLKAMKRTGKRRMRFAAMVVGIATVVQVPAVLTVGHLTGSYAAAIAAAALLTIPFLRSTVRSPFEQRPRSRAHLYLGMWPFYVWWTIGLAHFLFAPLALLAAALTPLSFDHALMAAGLLSVAGGLAALRRSPRIVEHSIDVADLPPELDGYRIAQLSDVHCGPFTPPARVRRWVDRANALEPDLIAVTGDLITSGGDYVAGVAAELGGLRAPDGVVGCMGNHDYFTDGEVLAGALQSHGMKVLRNTGFTIARGSAQLYVAGVDDTWTQRHDVARSLRGRPSGAPTVLLAHDPNLFAEAAAHGVELTLSGHTHGGQIAVPGNTTRWNLARIMTPFTAGLFRSGRCTLYVSRGLGTTGPPVRVGARPEIAVLKLRRAPPHGPMQDLAEEIIREASQTG
jgi:predicted MPP superfamily phosphohydrolase